MPDARCYLISAAKRRDSGHWEPTTTSFATAHPTGRWSAAGPQAMPRFRSINLGPMAPRSVYDRGYALRRELIARSESAG
jgi:hypothetical protein